MNELPHLLIQEEGSILIATFNRPEKLNALSMDLMRRLNAAVIHFRDSPELKVMLIRATGRYFSAGADLVERNSEEQPAYLTGSAVREMHRLSPDLMRQTWDEIEAVEKPFVVAHQGTCVGGGLELSLSCDFRLAATSARYSFPEGKFGILPATNGVSSLVRLVGPHWARYLIMANMIADAQKALFMGLVHEVFPDETFEEDVMNFCRHLAKQHGEQMGTAKLAIEMARDLGVAQARNLERMANSTLMLTPDYQKSLRRHIDTIGKGKGGT